MIILKKPYCFSCADALCKIPAVPLFFPGLSTYKYVYIKNKALDKFEFEQMTQLCERSWVTKVIKVSSSGLHGHLYQIAQQFINWL